MEEEHACALCPLTNQLCIVTNSSCLVITHNLVTLTGAQLYEIDNLADLASYLVYTQPSWLAMRHEYNEKVFLVHMTSIVYGGLVGAGSLWPTNRGFKARPLFSYDYIFKIENIQ